MDIVTARPAPSAGPEQGEPWADGARKPTANHLAAWQISRPPGTRRLHAWQVALAGLVLFALALGPRLYGIEQHLTADDEDWVRRASGFSLAVQRGDARQTYQSGHPGVPMLWLASIAIGPQRAAELVETDGKTPSYLEALFDARRALAFASATLTVVLAFLVFRLFGPGPALMAGVMLANEPFLVAHGRLLHPDPLLAQLMTASVLAALVFFEARGGSIYLVCSGVGAGLALLTKAPGVLLFGFVPLLALAWTKRRAGTLSGPTLRLLARRLAIWGLSATAMYVVLWPVLWVDPLGAIEQMVRGVRAVAESPRYWGNFFMGKVVQDDVGPFFYPVATLLRLSPLTLGGLLLLAWISLRAALPAWRPRIGALAAFVGLFTLMMSFSPKKIDRYLLPVFPVLVILGSLGLRAATRQWLKPRLHWPALFAVGLGQAALVASVQPYPLSFYDPLLGGLNTAHRLVIVGWGEGTDLVAAYLDRQPNAQEIVVTSLYHDLIRAQSEGNAVSLNEWHRANYLAHYINMEQRDLLPAALSKLVQSEEPVFTARINGFDYARVYAIPPETKLEAGSADSPRRTNVPRPWRALALP